MTVFLLDGSALAKRYVTEVGTPLLDVLFDQVNHDRLVVVNIGFAEVVSILVRRKNAGAISDATFAQGLVHLGQEIIHNPALRKLEPSNALVIASLMHIQNHSVNSTDAIVLHTALELALHFRTMGDDLTLVASDQRLLRAAKSEGLLTFDPEREDVTVLMALVTR